MKKLLTSQQACEISGVSIRVLRKLCRERRIKFRAISPRRRAFTEADLWKFIKECAVRPNHKEIDTTTAHLVRSRCQQGGDKAPRALGKGGEGLSSLRKEIRDLCR
jgi:hypothetical protein